MLRLVDGIGIGRGYLQDLQEGNNYNQDSRNDEISDMVLFLFYLVLMYNFFNKAS